jgi:transcriptional regulator NrdR family protein
MVCIYCGGKTRVTNSRSQKRLNQTWRRRECLRCRAVVTTLEACDYSASIVVKDARGQQTPFERDRLFASVYASLGHRDTATSDATFITSTIIGRLLGTGLSGSIDTATIGAQALEILRAFDVTAGMHYAAYHPPSTD